MLYNETKNHINHTEVPGGALSCAVSDCLSFCNCTMSLLFCSSRDCSDCASGPLSTSRM